MRRIGLMLLVAAACALAGGAPASDDQSNGIAIILSARRITLDGKAVPKPPTTVSAPCCLGW